MKTIIRIFLLFLFGFSVATASAGEPHKYFESLSTNQDFDYTFISPLMLQAMGDSQLSQGNTAGFPVSARDLSYIETISTLGGGENETLWKIIRKIKNDKKLETLSTRKKNFYRYDVFGKLSNDKKFVTNIMVITQDGGENVNVVYMEGKIPLWTINSSFNK